MIAEIREKYKQGENIVRLLNDQPELCPVGFDPVMVSYDLQAGSYVERELSDQDYAEFKKKYCGEIADCIRPLECKSLFEAGVGEGTSLGVLLNHLSPDFDRIGAVDISWSRLKYASKFLGGEMSSDFPAREVAMAVGDIGAIPLSDNCYELAFTSHAIEPNRGSEHKIVSELVRIASKYLVLVEPGYEFSTGEVRERLDYHNYCRGLPDVVKSLGCEILEYRLLENRKDFNPSAIIVAKVPDSDDNKDCAEEPRWCCPISKEVLEKTDGGWYAKNEGLFYPELGGTPCLLPRYAVLATGYEG